MSLDRVPRSGEKLCVRDVGDRPGGQVATAVLTCARLGLRSAYVGAVGDDAAGVAALGPLRAAGVALSCVKRVPRAASRTAIVLVEPSGERTILEHRPVALALRAEDLDRQLIETSRLLLVDAEHPEAALWAAGVAREAGIPVVLDVERPTPVGLELARAVDFPIVSRGFTEQLSSRASPHEALRALAGPATVMAVVTLGADGAVARHGDRVIATPAAPVDVCDTTGAGDAFRGSFASALLLGLGANDVLRVAAAGAALACRGAGAQGSLPDRAELEAFLLEQPPADTEGQRR